MPSNAILYCINYILVVLQCIIVLYLYQNLITNIEFN